MKFIQGICVDQNQFRINMLNYGSNFSVSFDDEDKSNIFKKVHTNAKFKNHVVQKIQHKPV